MFFHQTAPEIPTPHHAHPESPKDSLGRGSLLGVKGLGCPRRSGAEYLTNNQTCRSARLVAAASGGFFWDVSSSEFVVDIVFFLDFVDRSLQDLFMFIV